MSPSAPPNKTMAITHPTSGTMLSSAARPGTNAPWVGLPLTAAELEDVWDGTGFIYGATGTDYANVHLRFVIGDITKATISISGYGIGDTIPNEFNEYLWNYKTSVWDEFGSHTNNDYATISTALTSGTAKKYASGGVLWVKCVGGVSDVGGPPPTAQVRVKEAAVDSSDGKPPPRPRRTTGVLIGKWVAGGWNVGWND